MQSFGISGRVTVTVKKANGQVFSSTTDNDLAADIRKNLADRITSNGYTYNAADSPSTIKVHVRGHAADAAADWYTNALTPTQVTPGDNRTNEAFVEYVYADLVFAADNDTGLDLFPASFNAIEADGTKTYITQVQLLGTGSDVLAQAVVGESPYTTSTPGYDDLKDDVGTDNKIDNDDQVTVTYRLTFSATTNFYTDSNTSSIEYLKLLRDTVQSPATGPNVAVDTFELTYVDGFGATIGVSQGLGSLPNRAPAHINQWDSTGTVLATSIVYVGDPYFNDVGNVATMALTSGETRAATPVVAFNGVPSPNRPTGVTVKTSAGITISTHTITDTDIPSWNQNDNIKLSWFAFVQSDDI